jgi:molybdopterin-binding protein
VVSKVQDAGGMAMVSVDIGKRLMVEVTAEAVRELGIVEGQSIYCLIKAHSIRVA